MIKLYQVHGMVEHADYTIQAQRGSGRCVVARFKVNGLPVQLIGDRVYREEGDSFRYPVRDGQEIYVAGPRIAGKIQAYAAYIPATGRGSQQFDDGTCIVAWVGAAAFLGCGISIAINECLAHGLRQMGAVPVGLVLMMVGMAGVTMAVATNIRRSRAWIARIKREGG